MLTLSTAWLEQHFGTSMTASVMTLSLSAPVTTPNDLLNINWPLFCAEWVQKPYWRPHALCQLPKGLCICTPNVFAEHLGIFATSIYLGQGFNGEHFSQLRWWNGAFLDASALEMVVMSISSIGHPEMVMHFGAGKNAMRYKVCLCLPWCLLMQHKYSLSFKQHVIIVQFLHHMILDGQVLYRIAECLKTHTFGDTEENILKNMSIFLLIKVNLNCCHILAILTVFYKAIHLQNSQYDHSMTMT